jgi:hypothetical protein
MSDNNVIITPESVSTVTVAPPQSIGLTVTLNEVQVAVNPPQEVEVIVTALSPLSVTVSQVGIKGDQGANLPSGIASLDFGASSLAASVDVTGLDAITETSVVRCELRIEATADHSVDDLLSDPLRVVISAYTPGVGFTIYGTMDFGPAQGLYLVNWALA